jgi:hypothetical protein
VSRVPTTPPHTATSEKERTAFLLAVLRCGALRARLVACEIDAIGIALRGGMIDPDTAVAWLHAFAALPQAGAP